ncbi:MAG: hypothetical protein J0G35_02160 [Acidobacteriales bacterium]|nr:hypothetical protein [Terriglobales bacterium]
MLPDGADASPIGRIRIMIPEDVYRDGQNRAFVDSYMNGNAHSFFNALAGIWNR